MAAEHVVRRARRQNDARERMRASERARRARSLYRQLFRASARLPTVRDRARDADKATRDGTLTHGGEDARTRGREDATTRD